MSYKIVFVDLITKDLLEDGCLKKNIAQQEYASNWASADHCGVCDDHHKTINNSKKPYIGSNFIKYKK